MANSKGRPRKAEKNLRRRAVNIMLTDEEKRAYCAAATASGLALSQWVRVTLARAVAG